MRRAATALILVALFAAPAAAAQGKGKKNGKVPPGHLPPAGLCRVWYDGVPPGHQPAPTSCAEAERIAARSGNTRVIYGGGRDDRWGPDDGWGRDDEWGRARGGRDRGNRPQTGRAIPRTDRYPTDYPYPDGRYPDQYPDRRGGDGYQSVPFENGYRDGLTKGREDARDNDNYDPARHSWYRSGDRGYNSRYGTREEYRRAYRDGFLDGYEEAYRSNTGTRGTRPSWWPF